MEYRYLGPTGMKVSLMGLGNMMNTYEEKDEAMFTESLKVALDAGVNYLDTAEMYGFGAAESILGRSLKKLEVPRKDIVVSNKVFFGTYGGPVNTTGLSRKHIIEATEVGLERLQLDYVDIVFAHRYDIYTPLEEQCRAFNWLIEQGKALYWGTSEWTCDMVTRATELCDRKGWHRPVAEQSEYHCLARQKFEETNRPLYEKYSYGTTIWSPLCQGLLAGRYNDGVIPEGTRMNNPMFYNFIWKRYMEPEEKKAKNLKLINGVADYAKELGCT